MISGNLRVISWLNHRRFVKSAFDRIVAATVLLLLSPVMLIIAIAIHLKMGSPVVFTQARPGQHSQVFKFYKFRTMTDGRDKEGNLLPDAMRLTAFGQFLRKTSLDELPQLWNVVKGDMSFIGPRPLIVEYLERYSPEQARRHDVLPGITGLAQIKGRNTIAWEDKFRWDVWYVDNWSLWLDMKIFAMTVFKVLKQDGINQEGYATSAEFKGSVREN